MGELIAIRLARRARGGDLVVLGCFEGESPDLRRLPESLAKAASQAAARKGWKGSKDQISTNGPVGRGPLVALHGLGPRDELDRSRLGAWLERAARSAARDGYRKVTLGLPDHEAARGLEGALDAQRRIELAAYSFGDFLAGPPEPALTGITLLPPVGETKSYRRSLPLANAVASGVALARDLANTPPNVATPAWMAARARRLARKSGMKARVLGPVELRRMKMGGLVAVGGGSAHGPRLVRLETGSGKRAISFVGKGVTFDTGGISIKPARDMDEMKFDKSGACTVLGIARGAAELDLPFRLRFYLPLAENMPDGKAYRPGDIVRCYGGKSVEILNTDAEGRMILADALAWAASEKPDSLIDFATLTGACVVALGHHGAGLFSSDEGLAEELTTAAEGAGEKLWRLPLWKEFGEEMKGRHADLRNSGGRWGGASTAAAFLSNFIDGAGRWAHLDIAGPAYVGSGGKGSYGATGYGVSLALTWLLRLAGRIR